MDIQRIKRLKLKNFRSHEKLSLEFDTSFTLLSGPNGVGKTNVLEAISLFSPGRGLRGALGSDLGNFASPIGWNISAIFEIADELTEMELVSTDLGKKNLYIDGKKKQLSHLGSLLQIVWLTPLMDRLWIGASIERRKFLDRIVMNYFPEHPKNCFIYEQALKQRNRLIRENQKDTAWYASIEKLLAKAGSSIDRNRRAIIRKIKVCNMEILKKTLLPYVEVDLSMPKFEDEDELFELFVKNRSIDIASGRTLKGPHRSDLLVSHGKNKMEAKQCSTGEQKALLLSVFLANILTMINSFGRPPIILLDEITAHLDFNNANGFLSQLHQTGAQIFATSSERMDFEKLAINATLVEMNAPLPGINPVVSAS